MCLGQYDELSTGSPPSRVITAESVSAESELTRKWTAPSTNSAFAPPGWLLEIPHVPAMPLPGPRPHRQVGAVRAERNPGCCRSPSGELITGAAWL